MRGVSRQATAIYALFSAIFLFLQGTSTLLFRLYPALDEAFPLLLAMTRMVPTHSVLHILTALLAAATLVIGGSASAWFAIGFGLFYFSLGLVGAGSGHQFGLGLQPFDHPFHILLGGLGIAAFAIERWTKSRRGIRSCE